MSITVWCPHPGCGVEFDVRDAARGLRVTCPACHRGVQIGLPSEPPPLPEPAARPPVPPPPVPPQPATQRTSSRRRRLGFASRRAPGGRRRTTGRPRRQEPKSRHGCVTAWLVLIIVANVVGALLLFVAQQQLGDSVSVHLAWFLPTIVFLSLANVVCAVAVLNWKTWGVIGICLIHAAAIGIGVVLGTASAMSVCVGLIAPVVLLIVLQFGDRRSTWSQLE
jgi:hypothetical protein